MAGDWYTAFANGRLLASGAPEHVAGAAKAAQDSGQSHVLIFDDINGEQVEVDPFAAPPTIAGRSAGPSPVRAGRGRPKLGVVPREVTLLPRHWDWLASQPGGASAALRRLVEEASRQAPDQVRIVRERVYKVMTALAGDLPGYEAAVRALFAQNTAEFDALPNGWPSDIRSYLIRLTRGQRTSLDDA